MTITSLKKLYSREIFSLYLYRGYFIPKSSRWIVAGL